MTQVYRISRFRATLLTGLFPDTPSPSVIGDNPINLPEEDVLGRSAAACSFARQICELDASQGVVVGVLGAWGSGKTSFVNLARIELDKAGIPILDFNPWMFSGAEQLVGRFFVEVSDQLSLRPDLLEIAGELLGYGGVLSDVGLGIWGEVAGRGSKAIGEALRKRTGGAGGRRAKLGKALSCIEHPIAIVLDDIDRLTSSEIREVFKLVRLTACFPNIIYVLAFDRLRVEMALSDEGIPGRDYLEKILQVAVDLPAPPAHLLQQQILDAIDAALAGIPTVGPLDEQVWPDLFMEIIRPLIRNVRDMRRYAAAVCGTVRALEGKIALGDILALEAIRTFLPDVYYWIRASIGALTTTRRHYLVENNKDTTQGKSIEHIISKDPDHEEIIRSTISRLFPAAQHSLGGSGDGPDWEARWLRERRVAHQDILSLYMERVAGTRLLAYDSAHQAFPLMSDQIAFERYLRSLDPAMLEDVIACLEFWEDEILPEQVVPTVTVLLNIQYQLPRRNRGLLELEAGQRVRRVSFRILRSLQAPEKIVTAVREILPRLTSSSGRLLVIDFVGYQQSVGRKLVSESAAAELEREWCAEVRNAPTEKMKQEPELLKILQTAKRYSSPGEYDLTIPNDPDVTLAIIRSAQSEVRGQIGNSRFVQRSTRLLWNSLEQLCGGAEELAQRVDCLKQSGIELEADLMELIEKYASGWRPKDFGND